MKKNETLTPALFESLTDDAKVLYNNLMGAAKAASDGGSVCRVGYAVISESDSRKFGTEQERAVEDLMSVGVPIVMSGHEPGFRTIQISNIRVEGLRA